MSYKCPYCDAQVDEDAEHIFWWCTAWARTRGPYLTAIEGIIHRTAGIRRIKHYGEWPKITRTTMLFPEDPELAEMVKFLEVQQGERRIRHRHDWEDQERCDELYEDGRLAVFTDGGCSYPEHWKIRRASFGVFYGEGHAWNFHAPLVGRTQTVPRAELRAALWALEWAREPTLVVSDNLWTVKGIQAIVAGAWDPKKSHLDLWKRVRQQVHRLGAEAVAARWTKGHAKEGDFDTGRSNPEDARRNEGADALVHQGAVGWALPEAIAEHYLHTRRIAIIAQRMAVECLKARFAERDRLELEALALQQEVEQAFPEVVAESAHDPVVNPAQRENESSLRNRFPGFHWDASPSAGGLRTGFIGPFLEGCWKHLPFFAGCAYDLVLGIGYMAARGTVTGPWERNYVAPNSL